MGKLAFHQSLLPDSSALAAARCIAHHPSGCILCNYPELLQNQQIPMLSFQTVHARIDLDNHSVQWAILLLFLSYSCGKKKRQEILHL